MRILITRTTIADGRVVRAGSIEDLSDSDAAQLIQLGKAEPAPGAIEAEAEPAAVEPKRKGRKRGAE